MASGAVDEEPEGAETDGTHDVVGLAIVVDKVLCKDVTDGEAGEGGECLC